MAVIKKFGVAVFSILLVLSVASNASAIPFYTSTYTHSQTVYYENGATTWMPLPDLIPVGYVPGNVFYFRITLQYHNSYNTDLIDIYLSNNATHAGHTTPVVGHITPSLGNGPYIGWVDVNYTSYASFFSSNDPVYVGYACHFEHDWTKVEIDQTRTGTGVPEPMTMLLLGFGLMGLAGARRFKK